MQTVSLLLSFCLTPSLLSSANLKLWAHMQYYKKTKTKLSGLFSLLETWQMKNRGKEKTFYAVATALKPWRAHCNQSQLHRRAVVLCGKSGWRTVVFQEERVKMRENGSKWSWRAVEYCSFLLAVMNRPSEQTGEIGPRWVLSLLFLICQVCLPHVKTHTHIPVDTHGWRLLARTVGSCIDTNRSASLSSDARETDDWKTQLKSFVCRQRRAVLSRSGSLSSPSVCVLGMSSSSGWSDTRSAISSYAQTGWTSMIFLTLNSFSSTLHV